MSLTSSVQGSTKSSQEVAFTEGGVAVDLTSATISGKIKTKAGVVRNITGTLVIKSPATGGIVTWTPSATDTSTSEDHQVQLTATHADTKISKTIPENWYVHADISL